MWKKYCRARQATDGNVAHAHCMRTPKTKNAHSEFIILSLQQLLHERASMLSCAHTVLLIVVLRPSTPMTEQYLAHIPAATFQALSNPTSASRSVMYNMADVLVVLIFRKIQEDKRSLNLLHKFSCLHRASMTFKHFIIQLMHQYIIRR